MAAKLVPVTKLKNEHTMIANPIGFLLYPKRQWQLASSLDNKQFSPFLLYPVVLALIPSIAWYYGTTVSGWGVGSAEGLTRLTPESAFRLIAAFYFTMLISLAAVGYAISWMATTYGVEVSLNKGICIGSFAATPLFVIGIVGVYPLIWLDLSLGIAALCWSVYLLYTGFPVVMQIPKEQGFLYTSAVIAVCCVILMAIMGGSVILWDNGFMPIFTD